MRAKCLSACALAATIAAGSAGCTPHDTLPTDLSGAAFTRPPVDSGGLPDLIVDTAPLAKSWVIYDQSFPSTSCSVQESSMTPGDHRVLRFTVSTPNIGHGPVAVGDPLAHMAANDGLFEFATCHDHLHYRNYATYELVDPVGGLVLRAAKRGFCMLDVTKYHGPDAPQAGGWTYRSCGTLTQPGDQGISPGWADVYDKRLDGQFFVLDDTAGVVGPGAYLIRITVNPPFACGPADSLRPRDAGGMCHDFEEANYDNNVGEVAVDIPATVTGVGFGPGSGAPAPKLGQTQKILVPR